MSDKKPLGKKLGVWVNGKLRLQTRDAEAAHAAARGWMEDKRNQSVWLAPIGSFVTA